MSSPTSERYDLARMLDALRDRIAALEANTFADLRARLEEIDRRLSALEAKRKLR